jgi:hypothetical protein
LIALKQTFTVYTNIFKYKCRLHVQFMCNNNHIETVVIKRIKIKVNNESRIKNNKLYQTEYIKTETKQERHYFRWNMLRINLIPMNCFCFLIIVGSNRYK